MRESLKKDITIHMKSQTIDSKIESSEIKDHHLLFSNSDNERRLHLN
jgi:hypothetical protein